MISRARSSCRLLRNENRKQTITASTPRLLKSSAAARTSPSSSGVSTRPSGGSTRSVIGIRLRRRTSGFDCHGTSNWSEKLCGRLCRPICRMSRNPRVVSMPVSAPLCSIVMLVATVVPWTTVVTSAGDIPPISQISRMPLITPSDWSLGVLGTLCTNTSAGPFSRIRSVKVPPTSTPIFAIVSRSPFGPRGRQLSLRLR